MRKKRPQVIGDVEADHFGAGSGGFPAFFIYKNSSLLILGGIAKMNFFRIKNRSLEGLRLR
jgi:hypothetical protein